MAGLRSAHLVGVVVLAVLLIRVQPVATQPDPCRYKALTFDKMKSLLSSDQALRQVQAPFEYVRYIEQCGVAFIPDDRDVAELRVLDAPPELLKLIAPPVSPGNVGWTPYTDRRELRWVGAGTFTMGSPATEAGRGDDEDANDVAMTGFWLDRTEVTNDAFRKFVTLNPEWSKDKFGAGGHYLQDWTGDEFPAGAGSKPVAYVTWNAARAYAAWAGKRLPTEAEWEYAARAGSNFPYWWGPEFQPNRANRGDQSWAVDPQPATNAWGFSDMLGNVWEWTSTAYAPYPYRNDARETAGSDPRVIRGGSFGGKVAYLRAAKRYKLDPSTAVATVGFRCAFSPVRRASTDQHAGRTELRSAASGRTTDRSVHRTAR